MVKVEPLGYTSFKIGGKNASLIVNPFSKEATGLEWARRKADLILLTGEEAYDKLTGVEDYSYVVATPGEYEVKGLRVLGVPVARGQGGNDQLIYHIAVDGFSLLYLDSLRDLLNETELSQVGETDILFIPVGGGATLDPEKAAEVVTLIEPRIVVPMAYQQDTKPLSKLAPVEKFIEAMGEKIERLEALKLESRGDLPEGIEVVVLQSA